jgi:hypothetical protein
MFGLLIFGGLVSSSLGLSRGLGKGIAKKQGLRILGIKPQSVGNGFLGLGEAGFESQRGREVYPRFREFGSGANSLSKMVLCGLIIAAL